MTGTAFGSSATVRRRRAGLDVVQWPVLDDLGVDALVTTRHGGRSSGRYASLNLGLHVGDDPVAVQANRELAAEALGTGLDDLVFCEQTHAPTVLVVTAVHRGRGARTREDAIAATDALVTTTPGVGLVVMVADCVPLVLLDPVRRVLGVVHAGWPGTVQGVTTAALAAMTALGARPQDVVAGIGPSVDPARYQVGDDVRDRAAQAFGDRLGEVIRPDGTGRWLFDLWRANELQLLDAGVPAAGIHVARLPTGPGTDFFSHRFEGPTGRFAALARLHDHPG